MNRIWTLAGSIGRLPTLFRTLSQLRPDQARAQIQHAAFGLPAARHLEGPTPTLAIDRPYVAFLPPPAHVKSLGGGTFELLSNAFPLSEGVGWTTTEHGPLFAYHLHQHEFLRLPALSPQKRVAILTDWIDRHPAGIGWDPHPISLRLLCWGKLLISDGALDVDEASREAILRSMADQAETLQAGLEIRLQANHLLSNLVSLVFVGLVLDGPASDRWRGHVESLVTELDAQVRPDGGHEERSPMYHSQLLETLLDLLNVCLAAPDRVPAHFAQTLAETASRMLRALELWTHPDGRIALFADSAFDLAAEPSALRDYAERLGVPRPMAARRDQLPQTGYLRLGSGHFDLIASVSGPAPPHQPGHAHCDALAFELSVDGLRLVTDTGLFEYRPGRRRDRARTTASHSTLQIDGNEQAEIWAAHRIGGRPCVEVTAWNAAGSAEATCRGWVRGAPLHRRLFSVESDRLSIVDRVEGVHREVRFPIPLDPAWQVELSGRLARATRRSSRGPGPVVEFELPEAFEWRLERGPYYPTFGCEIERCILVGRASRCAEAVTRIRCSD